MLAKPTARTIFRAGMYAMLMLAGCAALWVPTPTLAKALGIMTYAWAIFLLIGGLCGLVACITDRWAPEIAGLPLLVSALTVYGSALLIVPPFTATKVVIGALMLSSAAGLCARVKDLWALSSAQGEAE